jgi:hypothetical protein
MRSTRPAHPVLLHLIVLMMLGAEELRQLFIAPCVRASTAVCTNTIRVLASPQNDKQGICSWKVPNTFRKKSVRRGFLRNSLWFYFTVSLCSVSKFKTFGGALSPCFVRSNQSLLPSHISLAERKQIIKYLTGNRMETAGKQFTVTALVPPFAMTTEFPQ